MLIAAKYEEIYPPYIKQFIEITDNAYTKEQILECEMEILKTIDFDMTFPTSLRFLERYSIIGECNYEVYYLSNYMLELSIIEVKMNKWNPSLLASSCIYISKKIKEISQPWSAFMV